MIGGTQFKTYEENVANVMAELDIVGPQKPDMVVFTEAVYQTGRDSARQSQVKYSRLNDEDVAKLCAKAKQYQTYICCSLYEKDDEEGPKRLTGLLINRQGEIQNVYHNTHLTMDELEGGAMLENELPVFQTDFGTVGIHIC
jgi:predicted amidohydrolase